MKNKTKIIARIIALTSALLLVVAFAVPCLADTGVDQQVLEAFETYVASVNPDAINPCYNALKQQGVNPLDYPYMVSGKLSGDKSFTDWVFNYIPSDDYRYLYCQAAIYDSAGLGSFIAYPNGLFDCEIEIYNNPDGPPEIVFLVNIGEGDPVILRFEEDGGGSCYLRSVEYLDETINDISTISIVLLFNYTDYKFMNGFANTVFMDDSVPNCFSIADFIGGYTVTRPDGVVPPAKTGLFGQLYYILSDAIYGQNVELGSTQEFALTLVSTLLVFCVVLLPVLLVVAMMFKLFRW